MGRYVREDPRNTDYRRVTEVFESISLADIMTIRASEGEALAALEA